MRYESKCEVESKINTMKKLALLFSITLGIFILSGCENQPVSDMETDLTEGVSIAEEEVYDFKASEATDEDISAARFGAHLFRGKMGISGSHKFFGKNFPPCATVSVSGDDFPKTITIDYADGCSGRNGLEKKGLITIVMSDTILNPGASYTITMENMILGKREVSKSSTITNEGQNEAGNWLMSIQSVSTTSFEKKDESYVIVRENDMQREWLSGFETPEHDDDQLLLSGISLITVNDTISFRREITEALLIDRGCKYPLSGIVEITRNGEVMTINFGDGECDNIAVITKDGESEEIDLDEGKFKNESGNSRNKRKNMKRKKGWW